MPNTLRALSVALVLGAVGFGGLVPGSAHATVRTDPATTSAPVGTVHRVVWSTAPKHGADVRSANLDGTDQVSLYASTKRRADNLTISHDGTQVAFGTYSRKGRAQLLITPITGGPTVDVLRRVPPIRVVGPVGWAPNDRRLVFEGSVNEKAPGQFYPSYLFTIRANGTGLRRIHQSSDGTNSGAVFGSIAWTSDGIYYNENYDIRRLRHGKSKLMFRSAAEMYASADGTAIFFRTSKLGPDGFNQVIYRSPTHNPHKDLVVALPDPEMGQFVGFHPNQDGSRLIGVRSGAGTPLGSTPPDTITYNPTGPRDIQVVGFVGTPLALAWY